MKRLYSCAIPDIWDIDVPYKINEEYPSIIRAYSSQYLSVKKIMVNIYWWLISRGKYRVWCAYDGKKLVHTSYVIPKCMKFPFLTNYDYEIGPCNTDNKYRGKGIYPAVLAKIVQERGRGNAYVIIDDMNIASIRGASKACFVVLPGKIKVDYLRRYVYLKED